MWFFDLLRDQEEKVKNWNGLCARCRGGELQWRLESAWRRHLRVDIVWWCRADRTCQWKEPGCNLHCCILARTSGRAGWIGLGVHSCEQLVLTFCKSFGRFVLQALFAVFDGHGGSQVSHIASKEFPKAGLRILSRPEKNLAQGIAKQYTILSITFCVNIATLLLVSLRLHSDVLQELNPVLDNYVIREASLVSNLKTAVIPNAESWCVDVLLFFQIPSRRCSKYVPISCKILRLKPRRRT